MKLVPEEKLAAKEAEFDAVHRHEKSPLEENLTTGRALKFYTLLTIAPELLADEELSAEQIFWSRYYWFSRYIKLRQALGAGDVALHQQALRILEDHPHCSADWTTLEKVEALASRDAAAQLGSTSAGED